MSIYIHIYLYICRFNPCTRVRVCVYVCARACLCTHALACGWVNPGINPTVW